MQKLTDQRADAHGRPTTPGSQTLMFTGQSGFYLQGEWEITTAQSIEGLDFGMTPVPTIYDQPAAQADSHTFILPAMDRDDEQVLRAMAFIKSMLDQGTDLGRGRPHPDLPAHVRQRGGTGAEPAVELRVARRTPSSTTPRPGTPVPGRLRDAPSAARSGSSCRALASPAGRDLASSARPADHLRQHRESHCDREPSTVNRIDYLGHESRPPDEGASR